MRMQGAAIYLISDTGELVESTLGFMARQRQPGI